MTISAEQREEVRQRANFACEFCGVTETDAAGQLTVDHFHPQARGGADALENLIYCCYRCNQYKADYWPQKPGESELWNPRQEAASAHFLELTDGSLYPLTAIGTFTIARLRLNRPPLVAYRLQKRHQAEEKRLLAQYRDLVVLLEHLSTQQATLLEEHRALLEEQRRILRVLIERRTMVPPPSAE